MSGIKPSNLHAVAEAFKDLRQNKMTPRTKLEKCEPDDMIYMSNPTQYKCKKCGKFWRTDEIIPDCHQTEKEKKEVRDKLLGKDVSDHIDQMLENSTAPKEAHPSSEWEEEFEELGLEMSLQDGTNMRGAAEYAKRIKDFIRQTLAHQKQEIVEEFTGDYDEGYSRGALAEREHLLEMVKGMRKQTDIVPNGPDDYDHCECENCENKTYYNQALTDILQALTKKEI